MSQSALGSVRYSTGKVQGFQSHRVYYPENLEVWHPGVPWSPLSLRQVTLAVKQERAELMTLNPKVCKKPYVSYPSSLQQPCPPHTSFHSPSSAFPQSSWPLTPTFLRDCVMLLTQSRLCVCAQWESSLALCGERSQEDSGQNWLHSKRREVRSYYPVQRLR